MSVDLSVSLGPMVLRSPWIAASGTYGYGVDLWGLSSEHEKEIGSVGAIVTKSLSIHPIAGNGMPRFVETPSGMINAIGLQNIGIRAFIDSKLPELKRRKIPVIVSIFSKTAEEFDPVADLIAPRAGDLTAVELNISCPNVKRGGLEFSSDPHEAARIVRRVRDRVSIPLFVKLSPNVTSIGDIAVAVEGAGADGFTAINTVLGMGVDIERRRPSLQNGYGGLSGPAIKPIAVRCIHQIRERSRLPILGVGGVVSARDALELIMVGATAVQIGTLSFMTGGHRTFARLTEELIEHCDRLGIRSIQEVIGSVR